VGLVGRTAASPQWALVSSTLAAGGKAPAFSVAGRISGARTHGAAVRARLSAQLDACLRGRPLNEAGNGARQAGESVAGNPCRGLRGGAFVQCSCSLLGLRRGPLEPRRPVAQNEPAAI
jgi:hypothetical protein